MLFFVFYVNVLTIKRLWSSWHIRRYKFSTFISVDMEIFTHPEIAQDALMQSRNGVKSY